MIELLSGDKVELVDSLFLDSSSFDFYYINNLLIFSANYMPDNYYFYDMNFRPLPINIDTVRDQDSLTTEKPEQFDEMIRIAKTLSEGLPFVRVDLYNQSGKVYFGELTLFDQSGFASDYVGEGDRLMGSFLHIGGNCA